VSYQTYEARLYLVDVEKGKIVASMTLLSAPDFFGSTSWSFDGRTFSFDYSASGELYRDMADTSLYYVGTLSADGIATLRIIDSAYQQLADQSPYCDGRHFVPWRSTGPWQLTLQTDGKTLLAENAQTGDQFGVPIVMTPFIDGVEWSPNGQYALVF